MSDNSRRSAYSSDDPYGSARHGSSPYGGSSGYQQQPGGYPLGSGRSYTSSRATGGAQGVRPVTASSKSAYASTHSNVKASPYDNLGHVGHSGVSRRAVIAGIAGAVCAGCLGFGGYSWYNNRAVVCTINGVRCKAKIGSTPAELIGHDPAYVSPQPGDLLALVPEGEDTYVVAKGQGNAYTLTVNGEDVDTETYQLSDGDELVFSDGTDRVEDTVDSYTPVACATELVDTSKPLVSVGYVAQWGKNGTYTVSRGAVSGNEVDLGVTEEPQNLVIAKSGINPADGRKLVALTFDDGPDTTYTEQYLDILAQYGAKATFFAVGNVIEEDEAHMAVARRVVEEGHQLSSHTYSHSYNTLPGLDEEEMVSEIKHTFEVIEEVTGQRTEVFRAPFGEFYSDNFLTYLTQGSDYNIAYVAYWTVDSLDWEMETLGYDLEDGAEQIVANATANVETVDYNGAIILMHDGGGDRSRDLIALPKILEKFKACGYECVTLNEMIAADPTFPSWVGQGYVDRPADAQVPTALVGDDEDDASATA